MQEEILTVQHTKEELEKGFAELQVRRQAEIAQLKEKVTGLTVGQIVHYVLESGCSKGDHRPAVVVRHWNSPDAPDMVQLQVFTDGLNDGFKAVHVFHLKNDEKHEFHQALDVIWRTSVHYSEAKEPGTCHWPERV